MAKRDNNKKRSQAKRYGDASFMFFIIDELLFFKEVDDGFSQVELSEKKSQKREEKKSRKENPLALHPRREG